MTKANQLISKAIQSRKPTQNDRDLAVILKQKYPEHFQHTKIQTLERRISYHSVNLGNKSQKRQTLRKEYTDYGLQLIKDFPNESIIFYAYKFAFHFQKSLILSRQLMAQLSKFKKIL